MVNHDMTASLKEKKVKQTIDKIFDIDMKNPFQKANETKKVPLLIVQLICRFPNFPLSSRSPSCLVIACRNLEFRNGIRQNIGQAT